jgi:hypothetical protein
MAAVDEVLRREGIHGNVHIDVAEALRFASQEAVQALVERPCILVLDLHPSMSLVDGKSFDIHDLTDPERTAQSYRACRRPEVSSPAGAGQGARHGRHSAPGRLPAGSRARAAHASSGTEPG